jgi:hypothetical protein
MIGRAARDSLRGDASVSVEVTRRESVQTPPFCVVRSPIMEPEVDVTLIDATLALSPDQRIEQNDCMLRMIAELRDGFTKSKDAAREAGIKRR